MTKEEFGKALDALEAEMITEAHRQRLRGFSLGQKARDQVWLFVEYRAMTGEAAIAELRRQILEGMRKAPESARVPTTKH